MEEGVPLNDGRERPRVAVLGMGKMGQALAGRLLDQGWSVVIWNRSPKDVSALEGQVPFDWTHCRQCGNTRASSSRSSPMTTRWPTSASTTTVCSARNLL